MDYVLSITPPGEGGISIVYLIGRQASKIIRPLFTPKHFPLKELKPNHLYLGYLYDQDNLLDEVIIHFIPANDSFSGMDTIEINSHGGAMPTKKIIKCLLKRGVREINQKKLIELAVRNKRLDTIQKEALQSLLQAPTTLASRVFLDQYNGALSKALLRCASGVMSPSRPKTQNAPLGTGLRCRFARHKTPRTQDFIRQLLDSASLGLALNYPKRIVIVGRPNTGKSTLFNALVGKERVIVHPLPGTTRDVIEEMIAIEEVPFILTDTAGWDTTRKSKQSLIEKLGIKKMKAQIKRADLIICLLDGSKPLTDIDKKIIRILQSRPVIWVINKSDLPRRLKVVYGNLSARTNSGPPDRAIRAGSDGKVSSTLSSGVVETFVAETFRSPPLFISALKQKGIEELRRMILAQAKVNPEKYVPGQPVIFSHRQYKEARLI